MVKHVALIIGCVILSFSAALIVPTNCSPIGENAQKETNLAETRSKRQTVTNVNTATSSATSNAQTQLYQSLFPILAKFQPPPVFGGLGGGSNGLAGVLKGLPLPLLQILSPLLNTLGVTVGNLGGTLDGTLDKIGNSFGILDIPLTGVGSTLGGLLGMGKTTNGIGGSGVSPTSLGLSPIFGGFLSKTAATANANSKAETINRGG